jgi:alpha-amylase
MDKRTSFLLRLSVIAILSVFSVNLFAQSGFNDDRVILQGFYWESYRFGHPEFKGFGKDKTWYEIVKTKAQDIHNGLFDMIWLPPPSKCSDGAGYGPTEYFNPNNMYGDSAKHRALLEELWKNGVEPIADIVINHRNGSTGWAGFINPGWGLNTICQSDEAFYDNRSDVKNTPVEKRGQDEEPVKEYDSSRERAFAYNVFRDIDHTNPVVRKDVLRYLFFLKSMGYRAWRYDMVHGYHATHIADYNSHTTPTLSVGEYDWDKQNVWRGWIWNTATNSGDRLQTASDVFDFSTYYTLKSSIGADCHNNANYPALYAYNNGLGFMGDNTDGLPWKNRAVTFLENHDTGWRTDETGNPQKNGDRDSYDSFANNWQVEQGYAYILTHPGIPCVFWKHYFDWGQELQNKIRALINARKIAGVNSGSIIHTQNNAKSANVYAAMIEGINGQLYVRIGGDDTNWEPSGSGYHNYREYANGNGWKVWIKLNDAGKNASFQNYPAKKSLGTIPVPKRISDISID